MSSLRVLHVTLSLNPGGTERLVIELVRRTAGHCESMVCCLDDEGAWANELRQAAVPLVALNRRPGFRASLGWRIAEAARHHNADLLHCHHYSSFVYGTFAALALRLPLVFTEHGRLSDAAPSRKRQLVNPVLGRLGSSIFAVSSHLREYMIAEGFPASQVRVIHNGVDAKSQQTSQSKCAAREALGVPAGAIAVGTAARLDPVKNLETLIEAFAAARDDLRPDHPSHLIIIGEGSERSSLGSLVAARGIETAVTFTGHRSDVRQLLHALDIFVNCSISEGISLTILEAMATGLPVVATAVGGTPEIVKDGETGVLIPPRDQHTLTRALVALAVDPNQRAALGTAARQRVLESFTLDRMVDAYLAEYRRVARKDN